MTAGTSTALSLLGWSENKRFKIVILKLIHADKSSQVIDIFMLPDIIGLGLELCNIFVGIDRSHIDMIRVFVSRYFNSSCLQGPKIYTRKRKKSTVLDALCTGEMMLIHGMV
jgi:hypothetical protein